MSSVYGLDYFDQPSIPNISSSSSFSGSVKFEIDCQNDYRILPMNSSITVGMKIVMKNEAGAETCLLPIVNRGTRAAPAVISVPYLAPNPVSTLFQRGQCICNKTTIGHFDNIAQTNTMYRYLVESKSEDNVSNSTNSLIPMNYDDLDVKTGAYYNHFKSIATAMGVDVANIDAFWDNFSSRMLWALKHQYGFDKNKENILTMQIPLPFFLQKTPIYIGSQMILDFVINGNWINDLIQIAGSPYFRLGAAGADSVYTVKNTNANFANNSINVSITSLNLRLCRVYQSSVPQSIQYHLKQYHISNSQINSSQMSIPFSAQVDKRVSHIIIGFVNNRNIPFKSTITDFSCNFALNAADNKVESAITDDATSLLKSMSVTFAGYIYPTVPYELSITAESSNHWGIAYSDYVNNCVNVDRCAPLMSYSQFVINPIFVFKTKQHVKNLGGSGSLNVSFNQTPTPGSSVYILCLYDEFITCYFNKDGELSGEILSSAGTTV